MSSTIRIPRDIDTATADASKEEVIRPMALIEMLFDSGPIRFNSSNINVYWDNKVWYGTGKLGKISVVRESVSMESHGISLSLSGVDPAHIALSLSEPIQGRKLYLYYALFDENSHLIKNPVALGPWRMDTMSLQLGKVAQINLSCESRMMAATRAKVKRYTDEEQQARYPGDKFFEFVVDLAGLDFNWGETEGVPSGLWGPYEV